MRRYNQIRWTKTERGSRFKLRLISEEQSRQLGARVELLTPDCPLDCLACLYLAFITHNPNSDLGLCLVPSQWCIDHNIYYTTSSLTSVTGQLILEIRIPVKLLILHREEPYIVLVIKPGQ